MPRTGEKRRRSYRALLIPLLAALPASAAELQFHQSVDRDEVGTEDTFRLTIVVTDAPDSAELRLPATDDFEILSKSQSTQMSYQLGGGGPMMQRTQKYLLVMRANRTGTLTLPPAVLTAEGQTYRTDAIRITVRQGRVADPHARAQAPASPPDPFHNPFGPPGWDDLGFGDMNIPRSDSDLFLRAYVDKSEPYVGEQVTLSLYIFSRVDLSSVDSVTMPKLEGFWSEDVESPTQLSGEQRLIDGVPYRAYLLKRRALFPVKAGTLRISPAAADITAGFLFAGRRIHKKGNELTVSVKPLPTGAPPGVSAADVGQWRLSADASQSTVELGQPVTVRVLLEGTGNLKNVSPPRLSGPSSLKIYDPSTTDRVTTSGGKLGGRRVQEYLVMPQQTGTFTLSGLSFAYFDPQKGRYEETRTEPISLTVLPGAGAPQAVAGPQNAQAEGGAKNVLAASGLRPLRHQARFDPPGQPVWRQRYFVPLVAGPAGLWLALGLFGVVRARLSKQEEGTAKRRQAKAARRRLAAAERLRAAEPAQFYGEIEKALTHFLEAKLGVPVAGLTREQLAGKMQEAGVGDDLRRHMVSLLDTCDTGRFGLGAAESRREDVLDEAAAAMGAWEDR